VAEALTASVAIPGLLPPQEMRKDWIATETATDPQRFQVIDGAAVRSNPLPAFFDWCKRIGDRHLVKRLERQDGVTPSLHVVYNVPTVYDGSVQQAPGMECPDIVLSAQQALQLAKRRDTRQELRQTDNVSVLEWHRQQLPDAEDKGIFTIQADEIAPRKEIDLGNAVSPDHEKLRTTVADGCRATLETLYREEIPALSGGAANIACVQLMRRIAQRRAGVIGTCGGLPAVCGHCTGSLQYRPAQNPNEIQDGVLKTYGRRTPPVKRS